MLRDRKKLLPPHTTSYSQKPAKIFVQTKYPLCIKKFYKYFYCVTGCRQQLMSDSVKVMKTHARLPVQPFQNVQNSSAVLSTSVGTFQRRCSCSERQSRGYQATRAPIYHIHKVHESVHCPFHYIRKSLFHVCLNLNLFIQNNALPKPQRIVRIVFLWSWIII